NIDPANPVQRVANPNELGLDTDYLEANGNFRLPADSSLSVSARRSQEAFGSSPITARAGNGAITEAFANNWDNRDISGEYLLPIGNDSELLVAVLDARNENTSHSSFAGNDSQLNSY